MTYQKKQYQYEKSLLIILLSLKVINTIYSANTLNADIKSISNWAYQWKMQFNPDPKKQTNEVIFSRKSNTV